MLTGRVPYLGLSPLDTLDQIRSADPVPPSELQPGVPRDLETVCLTCLQKLPAQRYASALALADDLDAFLNDRPIRRVGRPPSSASAACPASTGGCRPASPPSPSCSSRASSEPPPPSSPSARPATRRDVGRERGGGQCVRQGRRREGEGVGRAARCAALRGAPRPDPARLEFRRPAPRRESARPDRAPAGQARLARLGVALPAPPLPPRADATERPRRAGLRRRLQPRRQVARLGRRRRPLFRQPRPPGRPRPNLPPRRRHRPRPVPPRGHTHLVTALDFSRDGGRLASAGLDGTVRVWDTLSGKQLACLTGHASPLASICFDPTGRRVLSAAGGFTRRQLRRPHHPPLGNRDGQGDSALRRRQGGGHVRGPQPRRRHRRLRHPRAVRCLDAGTGVERRHEDYPAGVDRVVFSPDGALLGVGCWDGRVAILGASMGRRRLNLGGQAGKVRDVAFSADGRLVAAAGDTPEVRVWAVDTGDLKRVIRGPTDIVESVAFTPDGTRLATGDHTGYVKVWEVAHPQRGLPLDHLGSSVRTDVRFAPGGAELAVVASAVRRIDALDAATGRTTRSPVPGMLPSGMAVLSPEVRRLAHLVSDREPNRMAVSERATGEIVLRIDDDPRPICAIAYSPDGGLLLVSRLQRHGEGEYSFAAEVRDAATGRRLRELDAGRRHDFARRPAPRTRGRPVDEPRRTLARPRGLLRPSPRLGVEGRPSRRRPGPRHGLAPPPDVRRRRPAPRRPRRREGGRRVEDGGLGRAERALPAPPTRRASPSAPTPAGWPRRTCAAS